MPEESQSPSTPSTSGGQSSTSSSEAAPQGAAQPLPISPFTGEPFDPEWGDLLKKGRGGQHAIQEIMKSGIERKAD